MTCKVACRGITFLKVYENALLKKPFLYEITEWNGEIVKKKLGLNSIIKDFW